MDNYIDIDIDKSWDNLFNKDKNENEINLDNIYNTDKIIYPKKEDVFRVFKIPVNNIEIVIIAQDPYHTENIADGLCFSSKINIPPSLRNIFKEIQLEFPDRNYKFTHGDLSSWSENENIFLLNCALTVEKGKPGSNMKIWHEFTDNVIKFISENNKKCVFVLLGNFAKKKSILIKNNIIITGIHPSPLSANRGFFKSNIFKNIEKSLNKQINWQN